MTQASWDQQTTDFIPQVDPWSHAFSGNQLKQESQLMAFPCEALPWGHKGSTVPGVALVQPKGRMQLQPAPPGQLPSRPSQYLPRELCRAHLEAPAQPSNHGQATLSLDHGSFGGITSLPMIDPSDPFSYQPQSRSHRAGGICKLACGFCAERSKAYTFIYLSTGKQLLA